MVSMKTTSVPYSDFLRGPSDVIPRLDDGDVVLERRDADNLVLTRHARFTARQEGMTLAARLLRDVVRDQAAMVAPILRRELPWMRWLPDAEQERCSEELIAELAAGADTGLFEPFTRTLDAWRSTAEAWSDPEVAKRLQGPFPGNGQRLRRPRAPRKKR
jgi:hypothetical protein